MDGSWYFVTNLNGRCLNGRYFATFELAFYVCQILPPMKFPSRFFWLGEIPMSLPFNGRRSTWRDSSTTDEITLSLPLNGRCFCRLLLNSGFYFFYRWDEMVVGLNQIEEGTLDWSKPKSLQFCFQPIGREIHRNTQFCCNFEAVGSHSASAFVVVTWEQLLGTSHSWDQPDDLNLYYIQVIISISGLRFCIFVFNCVSHGKPFGIIIQLLWQQQLCLWDFY